VSILFGVVTGAIGMGYFIYGRRQTKFVPVIAGILLCVYPYFLDSVLWLSIVGVLLIAAPFVFDY
jgi:hypothetical protein